MVIHATVHHAVHYATLQNTELTIYHLSGKYSTYPDQDEILFKNVLIILASIYWPHLNEFLLGQETINLTPVALGE